MSAAFVSELEVPEGQRVWRLVGDGANGLYAVGPGLLRRTVGGWLTEGPAAALRDAAFPGPSDGWAVGAGGRVLRRTASGWGEERLAGAFEVTNVEAWAGGAVATAAGSEVWWRGAEGWRRWATEPLAGQWAGALWADGPSRVLVAAQPERPASYPVLWAWDGAAWRPHDTGRPGFVAGLHGCGDEAWAVGYRPRLFGKAPLCLRRVPGGWAEVAVPSRRGLTDVCVTPEAVFVGSSDGALLVGRDGSWARHDTPGVPTAVHASSGRVWVVMDGRIVYRCELGGSP